MTTWFNSIAACVSCTQPARNASRRSLFPSPPRPVTSCGHVVILLLLCIAGCSFDSGHGTVKGEVFLEGKPLKEGVVRFVPVDGQTPTASAPIADGNFTAKVPVGEMRVEFSAGKVVGKKRAYGTEGPWVEDTEELLAERYNVRSELKMKVEPGTQEKRFDLKTK